MTQNEAWMKRAGLAACLVMLFAGFAFAQTSTLSGSVTDPQGNAIAGATITATNAATGAVRTTVSSKDGSYQLPQLAPGTYKVRAEAKGFAAEIGRAHV